jgi:collagenase-like PrtC family protease
MTQITMPTPFDALFLDALVELNERHAHNGIQVAELYGSLPSTFTGTGRPQRSLPDVNDTTYERHVRDAVDRGFQFTTLFNTSCTANREFDPSGRRRMIDEMLRARDLGSHAIVVASPYLIDLCVKHVPDLRVHVSSVAFCKSTKEAAHYRDRGAHRLILDPDTIRDFRFLERLRREVPELEVEALCNHPCLLNCPYETYCYNSVSHGSSVTEDAIYQGFSLLRCNHDKLSRVVEFVKGSWFRPQDAHHYEAAGVGTLKIAGRGRSTDWLLHVADAYLSRGYHGDLMNLIWEAQWTAVWRSAGEGEAPPFPIRVDADAFDGFLDFFVEKRPDCQRGCGSCKHCDRFAEAAVSADSSSLTRAAEALEHATHRLL